MKMQKQNPKTQPLDEFHYHEAMHTTSVLMNVLDGEVGEHPAVLQDPKLTALAEKAVSAMYALYNAIAFKKIEKFSPDRAAVLKRAKKVAKTIDPALKRLSRK